MDWQAAMLTRLRGAAGVTALVSTKTFWESAPQDTALPYVTLFDVTSSRGQILNDWDLEQSRVQIDVWAATYASKNAIMEAVLAVLVPGGTVNGHKFQRANVEVGPRDIAGERDGQVPVYRKTADIIVPHTPV